MDQSPVSNGQSRQKMHRSLRITEIVGLVFSLLQEPTPVSGRRDLAETILNLLRCMPRDLWENLYGPDCHARAVVRPTRPIIASDWDRLLKYSHRVRSLQASEFTDPIMTHVFGALRMGVPGDRLLPNLQELGWGYISPTLSPFIDLFLGPQITSISIGHSQNDNHYDILPYLAQNCPRLSVVYIQSAFSTTPEDWRLSAFACALAHVQYLEVGKLDLAALANIGRLSTLNTLKTRLPDALSFPQAMTRTMFPHLLETKLEIGAGHVSALLAFVRTWKNTPLESFDADFHGTAQPHLVEEFCRVLGDHCVPDALDVFKFDISWEEENAADGFVYPGNIFRGLFCFRKLTVVSIHVFYGYDLDDALISDLAHAWPYLEELHLATDTPARAPRTPRVTLLGLQSLAQHFRDLTTVEMTFEATSIPPPPIAGELPTMQVSLISLHAAFSPISAAFPTARFLSATFPKLTQVSAWGVYDASPLEREYEPRWREVQTLLPGINEIRDEEWANGRNMAWQNIANAAAAVAAGVIPLQ
ncbi:hypothetical protein B0H11DRAFT_1979661 [Mycena galericulata]|nr:hypothetical protein B0H11DRAFT_1979661 [Mycena galericulata]